MSFCLAAAGIAVLVEASSFTLGWIHTIERTEWREVWRAAPEGLIVEEARVKGSGAGMEPPAEARLEDGFYVWEPEVPPQREIVLRRAEQAGDWTLCAAGKCAEIGEWLDSDADPVRLSAVGPEGNCASAEGVVEHHHQDQTQQ